MLWTKKVREIVRVWEELLRNSSFEGNEAWEVYHWATLRQVVADMVSTYEECRKEGRPFATPVWAKNSPHYSGATLQEWKDLAWYCGEVADRIRFPEDRGWTDPSSLFYDYDDEDDE